MYRKNIGSPESHLNNRVVLKAEDNLKEQAQSQAELEHASQNYPNVSLIEEHSTQLRDRVFKLFLYIRLWTTMLNLRSFLALFLVVRESFLLLHI